VFISWPRRRSRQPGKTVFLPDLEAGCSLATPATRSSWRKWKAAHPDVVIVAYINCTAAVKALWTSSARRECRAGCEFDSPDKRSFRTRQTSVMGDDTTGPSDDLVAGRVLDACALHAQSDFPVEQDHPDAEIVAPPECLPPSRMMATSVLDREMVAYCKIRQRASSLSHRSRHVAPLQRSCRPSFHPRPYRLLPLQRMRFMKKHAGESRRDFSRSCSSVKLLSP